MSRFVSLQRSNQPVRVASPRQQRLKAGRRKEYRSVGVSGYGGVGAVGVSLRGATGGKLRTTQPCLLVIQEMVLGIVVPSVSFCMIA